MTKDIIDAISLVILIAAMFWAANNLAPDSYSGECELARAALAAAE